MSVSASRQLQAWFPSKGTCAKTWFQQTFLFPELRYDCFHPFQFAKRPTGGCWHWELCFEPSDNWELCCPRLPKKRWIRDPATPTVETPSWTLTRTVPLGTFIFLRSIGVRYVRVQARRVAFARPCWLFQARIHGAHDAAVQSVTEKGEVRNTLFISKPLNWVQGCVCSAHQPSLVVIL
jgi:hypothetical protein